MAQKIGLEGVFETGGFLRGLGIFQTGVNSATSTVNNAQTGIGSLGAVAGTAFNVMGAAAVAAGTLTIAALGGAAVAAGALGLAAANTAITIESAWASVLKTTDGLVDEFGNLTAAGEEVRNGFRELAQAVPVDLAELMELGALAAQLGVAEDQVVGFTETMAALGVSTNISAQEAATAIAQIQNIFNVATDDMSENASRFGSALVDLGNNFATTERDILNFAQRIAGAGQIAGLTQADILGIGAALASVGVEAEAGGTAVQKVLLEINEAVTTSNEKLQTFAETAGMTADEFAEAWQTDAAGAFREFVEGLGEQGDAAIQTLSELGLEDQRLIRAFLSLAGAGDLLAEALIASNEAFAANSALAEEAGRRYATAASQFFILKNTLRDIALVIGDMLLPYVNKLVSSGIEMAQVFGPKLQAALQPAIDAMGRFFQTIAEGELGARLLPLLAGFLEDILDAGADADFSWVDALADGINNIAGVLADGLESEAFAEVLSILNDLSTNAVGLSEAVGSIGGITGVPSDVIESFQSLLSVVEGIGGVFATLAGSDVVASSIERIAAVFAEIGGNAGPAANEALAGFAGFMAENNDEFIQLGEGLSQIAAFLVEQLPNALDLVGTVFGGLAELVGDEISVLLDIFTGDWAGAWETMSATPGKVFDLIVSAGGSFVDLIAGLFGSSGAEIGEAWGGIWDNVSAIAEFAWTSLSTAFTDFGSMVGTIWGTITTSIGEFGASIGESWGGIWENIMAIGSSLWASITTGFSDFATGLGELLKLDSIGESFGTIFESMGRIVSAVGGEIAAALGTMIGNIVAGIGAFGAQIAAVWGGIWGTIAPIVSAALSTAIGIVASIGSSIVATVGGVIGGVAGAAAAGWNAFVAGVGTALAQAISAAASGVITLASNIASGVSSAAATVSGMAGDFGAAGVAIVQGLIGGAASLADAFIGTLADMAAAAAAAVEAAFGIASPSKWGAWVGEMTVTGLVGGVKDSAAEAASAISDAFTGMIDPAMAGVLESMKATAEQVSGKLAESISSFMNGDGGQIQGSMIPGSAGSGTVINNTNNYEWSANYGKEQSPFDVIDDIVLMNTLTSI